MDKAQMYFSDLWSPIHPQQPLFGREHTPISPATPRCSGTAATDLLCRANSSAVVNHGTAPSTPRGGGGGGGKRGPTRPGFPAFF